MSNLISGKDAKKAWADGEEIEIIFDDGSHGSLLGSLPLDIFENVSVKFKLKPQTITINGIEVPKPDYIVDTPHDYDGCWEINIGGTYYLFKTEQNYKQVVEALRSVLNG